MDLTKILIQIRKDIAELKKNSSGRLNNNPVTDKWVPRSAVMIFLNYKDTQMAELEKSGDLITTKIGRRIFIHKDSIARLLDKNIVQR